MQTLDFEVLRGETQSRLYVNVSYNKDTDQFYDLFIEDDVDRQEIDPVDLLEEDRDLILSTAREHLVVNGD